VPESRDRPYPPFDLATRTIALPSDDMEGYLAYEFGGASTKSELLRLLPPGTTLEGLRVLDFGCGAGRTLRHFLEEAGDGEFWGADIDAGSIAWLHGNLCPPLNAVHCDVDPPLAFESESFDLAWAISVFTHLGANSAAWLLELHRILRPGGLLMASYMGEWNSERVASEPWDEGRIGMNMLRHNNPWDLGGPMILMSDWWVREHWGRAFEVVATSPWVHNQTWLMLRKKDVVITQEELLTPGDDPREWTALRHNLVQLQREIEAVQRTYEGSGSWRATRPLRALKSRLERWLSRASAR